VGLTVPWRKLHLGEGQAGGSGLQIRLLTRLTSSASRSASASELGACCGKLAVAGRRWPNALADKVSRTSSAVRWLSIGCWPVALNAPRTNTTRHSGSLSRLTTEAKLPEGSSSKSPTSFHQNHVSEPCATNLLWPGAATPGVDSLRIGETDGCVDRVESKMGPPGAGNELEKSVRTWGKAEVVGVSPRGKAKVVVGGPPAEEPKGP
jgi:hypothetical protein